MEYNITTRKNASIIRRILEGNTMRNWIAFLHDDGTTCYILDEQYPPDLHFYAFILPTTDPPGSFTAGFGRYERVHGRMTSIIRRATFQSLADAQHWCESLIETDSIQ